MKVSKERAEKGLWWDRGWSLVEGCTPVSEGCKNCWSAAQTYMRAHQENPVIKERYEGLTDSNQRFNGKIRLMWEDLKKPTPKQQPMTWAVWNDLFHEKVPFVFGVMAFERMYLCPQHTFIVCTKRSRSMRNNMPVIWAIIKTKYPDAQIPLPNVIGMVTAEDQENANLRISDLIKAPFAIRAVNVEPMLERIYLGRVPYLTLLDHSGGPGNLKITTPGLHWIVCGAEKGPEARPMKLDNARHLKDQSKESGVPFWMKAGNAGEELPEDLKVRELPILVIDQL